MFTTQVRNKLATDYGIQDIPHELLVYLVRKHKARVVPWRVHPATAEVAFMVAAEWQRGKEVGV